MAKVEEYRCPHCGGPTELEDHPTRIWAGVGKHKIPTPFKSSQVGVRCRAGGCRRITFPNA